MKGLWGVLAVVAGLLAGCDAQRVAKLEEGVSTEVEVRKEFGEPVTIITEADGSRVFEYPRQPEGWTNYLITIGADGKMSSLRQLLNDDNFARVQPGMDKLQVRKLLGRHAKATPYALKNEEHWDWRYRPDPNSSRIFTAVFGPDGKVLRTEKTDDTRDTSGGK